MQTIETSESLEAQRCRRAQYSGLATVLTLNGSKYRGKVIAVKEVQSAQATCWIVRIAPQPSPYKPAYRLMEEPEEMAHATRST